MNNPLEQPFDIAPFSKITSDHFLPAIKNGIALAKKEVNTIVGNPEPPSFTNTIEALDYSGELLDRVTSVVFNLNSAETIENIQ